MKDIKYTLIIFIVFIMLGCWQKREPRHHVKWGSEIEADSSYTILKQDTAEVSRVEKEKSGPAIRSVSYSKSVRSSSRSYNNDDDNLRGWDPASEDDLDDNGMSRYMENNDEEGWD